MEIENIDPQRFYDGLRRLSGVNTEEDKHSTDLDMGEDQFVFRMGMEDDGDQLLRLLREGEWSVVIRMGLCSVYKDEKENIRLRVPRWNNFIGHLRIVAGVFYGNPGNNHTGE